MNGSVAGRGAGRDDTGWALTPGELADTIASVAALQLPDGMIPWFPGGHCDPWNHVEAAMALSLGGLIDEAEAAYEWLAGTQQIDGSWQNYVFAGGVVEDAKRDTNTIAYVAAGVWHHHLALAEHSPANGRGALAFLDRSWPMVERAIEFVLGLQEPGGEILWAIEPDGTCPLADDGTPARYGLLPGSSSIHHPLRCGVAVAEAMGLARPDWELAAGRLAHAVAHRPDAFEPKVRWAMDWYYPVLSGAIAGDAALSHLDERWDEFVIGGYGVRCVHDSDWVTAAETAECAMAYDAAGDQSSARVLLAGTRNLRDADGSYWTGIALPDGIHFPDGEHSSYTAASIVLAHTALTATGPLAGLFRGEGIPASVVLQPEADIDSDRG